MNESTREHFKRFMAATIEESRVAFGADLVSVLVLTEDKTLLSSHNIESPVEHAELLLRALGIYRPPGRAVDGEHLAVPIDLKHAVAQSIAVTISINPELENPFDWATCDPCTRETFVAAAQGVVETTLETLRRAGWSVAPPAKAPG